MRIKKVHPEIILDSEWNSDPHKLMNYMIKIISQTRLTKQVPDNPRDLEVATVGQNLLDQDEIFNVFFGTYMGFRNFDDRKIYLLGKDFFDVFKETSLENVLFRHLPENCAGYVELPYSVLDDDGDEFSGFYFVAVDAENPKNPFEGKASDKNKKAVVFGYVTRNSTYGSLHGVTENTEAGLNVKLKDEFETKGKHTLVLGEETTVKSEMSYTKTAALLFNILVYLNSGHPDLRAYRNEVRMRSPTSKKVVRADKELSVEEVVLVGWGFKKEPLYTSEGWVARAHMGWRRCGTGRTQLKWTFISQSKEKHWKEPTSEDGED